MNVWMLALLALIPPLAIPTLSAFRGTAASRLVSVQLASAVAALALGLMTFAFDQSAFMDLPLCLVLLSIPGTLLISLFLERWL